MNRLFCFTKMLNRFVVSLNLLNMNKINYLCASLKQIVFYLFYLKKLK